MKKALSILLCLTLVINIVSTAASVNATTTTETETTSSEAINTPLTYNLSWSSDVEEKTLCISIDQTGYYNMSVTDHFETSTLEGYLYDSSLTEIDDKNWQNEYAYFEFKDSYYCEENLYLMAGHTYEIVLKYCDYDPFDPDTQNRTYHDASLSISFDKTDYAPTHLTLGSAQEINVSTTSYSWFEFTTTDGGDYHINSNIVSDSMLTVYNKNSGLFVSYLYWNEIANPRIHLEANTDYIVKLLGRDSSYTTNISVSKASGDVAKVEIINQRDEPFLPEDGDMFDYYWDRSLDGSGIFCYKVTYSNGETFTGYYDDLLKEGIIINELEYTGEIYKVNDKYLLATGEQPILIHFNGTKSPSYVYVADYEDEDEDFESDYITDDYGCICDCPCCQNHCGL